MRVFLTLLFVLFLGAASYGYMHNPEGCRKLGTDVVALFTEASVPTDISPPTEVAPSPDHNSATTTTSTTAASIPAPNSVLAPPPDATTPTAAADPPATPFKKWAPPAVIPAQPHWTWITDDKTYEDVVINKIESDTVTITHSLGVTQLDIATLPPDIQKQLNYDPAAAAATKAEAQREADHPYYPMSNIADAEAMAKQMHWPIAWLCSFKDHLSVQNPDPNSDEGLTQMALNELKTRSIVIFEDGGGELNGLPPAVVAELFHLDDGPLPNGHHYYAPKIVFSSPDATKTFGRVSHTQMSATGMAPIDAIFANIQSDPSIQAILGVQPAPSSSPTPAIAPVPTSSNNSTASTNPPAQPFKKWTPPAVFPAQPHWTWTTDDKNYEDVVITKIESDTVTITHSLGVTQLDIATLPPDIQKQLNYDPAVAAATKAEIQREQDHPFYPMSNIADAEALAKQMHWPIAWLFSDAEALSVQNPNPESYEYLTQIALADLKTQTIVIFEKGNEELPLVPPAVIAELFHLDDGPIEGGHHYYPPKIVISSPDAKKTFGRVSFTQMKAAGMEPVDAILSNIQSDPSIQAIFSGQPAPPASSTPNMTFAVTSSPNSPTPSAGQAESAAPAGTNTAPVSPSPSAQPENWTVDGKDYHNVTVTQVDPDKVHIIYDAGVGTVPLADLPPELQKRFNYDPIDAQAAANHAATLQPNGPFQNGDFSHGDDHWQGDGKTPQAFAKDNPAALTDPLTSKGLIVALNPSSWTRIYQAFASANGTHYSIVVTYKLSPNISLSKNAADYADISKKIQIPGFENFGSLPMQPGDFYGTIGDPTSTSMSMELFVPPVGSDQVQTYQHTYPPVPISPTKTFALAFPPGTGTVVILSVDVTAN